MPLARVGKSAERRGRHGGQLAGPEPLARQGVPLARQGVPLTRVGKSAQRGGGQGGQLAQAGTPRSGMAAGPNGPQTDAQNSHGYG